MLHNENSRLTAEQLSLAALGLLVTSGGNLYMLNLLVRTANASVAQRAALELGTALRIRIAAQVAAHGSETSVQIPSLAMRVERAARAVEMALPTCRSRSPRDFADARGALASSRPGA
jgi:hypothetical protein